MQHTERCFLTSAVTQVVEGATITKFSIDQYGNPIPHGKIELAPDTFQRYDLLSAALGQIDDRLRAAGQHERSGRVKIDEIAVVDVFGSKRTWTPQNSNTDDPRHPQAPDSLIGCSPRLPHWSRLMCRFMSADSPGVEAEYGLTPVAGFLLPDFVEHALEVFDNKGQAIGQLLSDPPIRGKQGPKTLQVRFEPHAWLNHQGPAINAITNPYLKELVAGILAQPQVVPANAEKEKLFESGLTALLRVFDTAGGTVAWDGQHGERNIRLFGKPVAVVRTKLWIETSGAAKPGTDPQAHPAITVQIGAVTRPEDGVYGVFLPNAQPALSRFAPVDKQVVEQAVLNGLRDSVYRGIDVGKLDHPFVADPAVGQSRFTFTQNQQRELSILRGGRRVGDVDVRGAASQEALARAVVHRSRGPPHRADARGGSSARGAESRRSPDAAAAIPRRAGSRRVVARAADRQRRVRSSNDPPATADRVGPTDARGGDGGLDSDGAERHRKTLTPTRERGLVSWGGMRKLALVLTGVSAFFVGLVLESCKAPCEVGMEGCEVHDRRRVQSGPDLPEQPVCQRRAQPQRAERRGDQQQRRR